MSSATALLAVEGLAKSFGGLSAVSDLSFTVDAGETVGLIGPNGSGKTTVLNLLTGSFAADAGRVSFAGVEFTRVKPDQACRAGIARTFQLVRPLRGLTVEQNVVVGCAFGARRQPLSQALGTARELLALVGLSARAGSAVDDLTYIDQKRMELARALAAGPRLLLLDEWLAGLNPAELEDGIALLLSLKRRGIAIMLVEHVMQAVRSLCDRCIVLNAGRLAAEGRPDQVLADPEVVRVYLGDDHA